MAKQEIKLADWQDRWVVVFRPGNPAHNAEYLVISETMTHGKSHAITKALDYFENPINWCKATTRRGQWRYLRRQYDCCAVRVRFELVE